jgi:hypothetical protein
MPDHDHDYAKVQVFHPLTAALVGEGQACRICGESDPDNPVPEAMTITEDDVAVVDPGEAAEE